MLILDKKIKVEDEILNDYLKYISLFMDKAQLDRLDMALVIENYLKKNSGLISANVPLMATAELLSSKISKVKDQLALQLVNHKGTTIEKRNRRKALENKAFVLASACCSYALALNDDDFYNRCYYSRSAFVHFKDAELIGICVNLLREIRSRESKLIPYNITTVMIADFKASIDNFSEIIDKPREARSQKAEATAKIAVLLTEISDVIWRRLDSNMVSMSSSNPEFVSVYKNLRSIKKTPVQKRSLTIVAVDSQTKSPVADVTFAIGKNIIRTSGRKGISYVQSLSEGTHQLIISHPDYESQSFSFLKIRGETNKVGVVLERRQVPGSSPIIDYETN